MYTAKLLEQIDNEKGYWDYQRIGVFDANDHQIGEYRRNYSSGGEATFHPFQLGNAWYALYSPKYTGLRILRLTDRIEDIGGEACEANGFCPTDIYIPRYQWWATPGIKEEELHKYPKENHVWLVKDRWEKQYDDGSFDTCFSDNPDDWSDDSRDSDMGMEKDRTIYYENFAFVAGCRWGDDSSHKIEIRDLSEADKGIIKTVSDWGYYEIPNRMDLRKSITLNAIDQYDKATPTNLNITLAIQKTLRLHGDSRKVYDFDDAESVQRCFAAEKARYEL